MTLHDVSQISFLVLILLWGGAVGVAIREWDRLRNRGRDE